jgi:hypothetical protein
MGTRILIVLVVLVVLLAVLAIVLGANRKDRAAEKNDAKTGDPPAYAGLLDGAFGWMAPTGFDLKNLQSVDGAVLNKEKRTLVFTSDKKVTITVRNDPEADPNSCRSLTLALVQPKVTGPGAAIVELQSAAFAQPLPDKFEQPDAGQFLPNPKVKADRWSKKIDPKKYGECTIPVFKGGATIVLLPKRDCTVEIR